MSIRKLTKSEKPYYHRQCYRFLRRIGFGKKYAREQATKGANGLVRVPFEAGV